MSPGIDNGSIDYDKVSKVYDTSRVANVETIEKLIHSLQLTSDSIVLDMGCGTGNYTSAIQRVTASTIGIDASIGMLKRARAKFSNLPLVCGDITGLPFKSGTFDAAFAIQVLHHVREKASFLKEANRLLRKGARLAIDSCSHQQMRTFWLYHYFPKGLDLDLRRIPGSNEIASLLEKAGFLNVTIEISYTDIAVEHEKPEHYLDRDYRSGQSTFNLLAEKDMELGCRKLREDIESGIVESIIREFEEKEKEVGGSCIIYGTKGSY